MWEPITLAELYDKILDSEQILSGDLFNFWHMIKIEPEKWQEEKYGAEGGGFWTVAIYGRSIILYNDIEEGFNISSYSKYGHIDEYCCNQDPLFVAVRECFNLITFGGHISGRAGPPINIS